MRKLSIDLTDEEYLQSLQKKGDRTCREVYLSALGIDCKERLVGRPSNLSIDEMRDKFLEEGREKTRAFYQWEMREKLAESKKQADEAARKLGLDGMKGDLPALGLKKKSKG